MVTLTLERGREMSSGMEGSLGRRPGWRRCEEREGWWTSDRGERKEEELSRFLLCLEEVVLRSGQWLPEVQTPERAYRWSTEGGHGLVMCR
jgi:hypothetical protein